MTLLQRIDERILGLLAALFVLWRMRQGEVINIIDDLPRHPTKRYGMRPLSDIQQIVLHHSGTTEGGPYEFARYHVEEKGWPGIAYHYVVMPDGTIYQTNRLTTISYHVSGHNTRSVGICLAGNYDMAAPPEEQIWAAARAVQIVANALGWEPPVFGHRDFSQKSCPGSFVNPKTIAEMAYQKQIA